MSDNYDEFLQWLNEKKTKEDSNKKIDEESEFNQETASNEETKNFEKVEYENENIEDNKQNNDDTFYQKRAKLNDDNLYYVDKNYVDEQIKKNKPKFGFIKTGALVLTGAILGSLFGPIIGSKIDFQQNQSIVNENANTSPININTSNQVNVENAVAKKAIPSVVGIHTSFTSMGSGFFGMQQEVEGIGSGVIVSEDGYILTNAHVVGSNDSNLTVVFSDNTNQDATIVYMDETLDLAVIKVNKTGLPAIEFEDSESIQIGDKAIAIGNPLGFNLQSTLTSGYISGLNRTITMQDGSTMNGLIQTDASINQGNSGGALLNDEGKLIGINTAKAGSTDGIGFAIPSNIAKNIVNQIIENGSFTPVVLGIRGKDLPIYKQYYTREKIDIENGVVVADVEKNSSADKAGIKANDIITKINDIEIDSMNNLKQTLIQFRSGDKGKITIFRDGKEEELNITFEGEQPNI